jgi:hypothetical protein
MDNELPYDEQLDVAIVLFHMRDVIAEAYLRGLPTGMYSTSEANRIDALLACKCVLSADLRLCDRLRPALEHVLGERHIGELTIDDCKAVAAQYREWLDLSAMSAWHSLVYKFR